jgi:tRNA(adenine34) deaminase
MERALALADEATDHDVPVAALVLRGDEVLAARHNEKEHLGDPTAHAEILALRDAAVALGTWRLDGCTLVVTLEPCPMCAGAAWASRLDRVVFGAFDMKAGALTSLYGIGSDPRLNHEFAVTGGVLAERAAAQLSGFFADLRTG